MKVERGDGGGSCRGEQSSGGGGGEELKVGEDRDGEEEDGRAGGS